MSGFVVRCECGSEMWVTASAVGTEETCSRCGAAIAITEDNLVCFEDDGETPRAEESETVHEVTECTRCGKPFRGEWDKYPTDQGTFCHICANLAGSTVAIQHELSPAPGSNGVDEFAAQLLRRAEVEQAAPRAGRSTVRFRVLAVGLLVLLVVLLVVKLPPRLGAEPAETGEYGATHPPVSEVLARFSPWQIGLAVLLALAPLAAKRAFALYLTLDAIDKLPNEAAWKNVIAVGVVACGIGLIELACGFFLFCFGPFIGFVAGAYIVGELYDFDISHYLTLVVMALLVFAFSLGMEMLLAAVSSSLTT